MNSKLLFRVTESSGKEYEVFTDGRIDGFEAGAVVCNYFPLLLASGSMSHASACPTCSETDALIGAEQPTGVIEIDRSNGEKIRMAAGEK